MKNTNLLLIFPGKMSALVLVISLLSNLYSQAADFFWVRGAGNWSDFANHWATTSGGTTMHTARPGSGDNVFFDANSGFIPGSNTVTTDVNPSSCLNMTWSGAPANPVLLVTRQLIIYGNLQLQPGMSIPAGSSNISFFSPTPGQTITTNGVDIKANVSFDNAAGGWTLMDPLKSSGNFTFTRGNLNTNGQPLNLNNFPLAAIPGVRTLNISNSTIDVAENWNFSGTNTALTAANSLIRMNGRSNFVGGSNTYNNVTFTGGTDTIPTISGGTYNQVVFLNNGSISGITTNRLLFSGVNRKYLIGDVASTINQDWEAASPNCSSINEIYHTASLPQGAVNIAAGAVVNVANARITNIQITGTQPSYAALNAFDGGNNSGWTFTPHTAQTYYWVGGAGDWNDANHWASQTNGSPGSGCIPTPADNVVFDAASGFIAGGNTVTLSAPNVYCNDIIWSGAPANPQLATGTSILEIAGSLQLQTGMTVTTARTAGNAIIFTSSDPNETITTNGVRLTPDIDFNGTGTWQLQDSLSCSALYLNGGNLNFNGNKASIDTLNDNSLPPPVSSQARLGLRAHSISIANATIHVNLWSYANSLGAPLTPPNTAQSTIDGKACNMVFNSKSGDVYNNLTLFCPSGTGEASISGSSTFKKVLLSGNTRIISNLTTDTLIFTAGHTYEFDAAVTTTVNNAFYASGTPCSPVNIKRSLVALPGGGPTPYFVMPLSAANLPNGVYGIDYVNIQDVSALTGPADAQLQVGPHSTISGNSTGWQVASPSDPAIMTGLGADTATASFPVTIRTTFFYGNPTTNYLWNNGSTADSLIVNEAGTYTVTVDYGNGCVISDDIMVSLVLPVALISFTGKRINDNNQLNWTSETEVNTLKFEVEYSGDGLSFRKISTVMAAGNSTVLQHYQYVHTGISSDAWYRLKMIDQDGSFEYSNIIRVSGLRGSDACVVAEGIYPVPFTDELTIKISSCQILSATISLVDLNGKEQIVHNYSLSQGTFSYILGNLDKLSAGMYLLKIQAGDGTIVVQKVMKQ